MKKILLTSVLTLMTLLFMTSLVYANDITVTIDGQPVTFAAQAPVIVDGRTLVPVRGVFEQMGFDVDWDGGTRQATLTNDDYTVTLIIGSATFTTNGTSYTLDVPAQIIGGSTMLPIRAVLESVGYYLDWDGSTSTVLISSTPVAEQTPPTQTETDATPDYITIQGNSLVRH